MQELNLRLGQAVALTYAQTDENFKRLKTAIDALEVAVAGAGLGTVTSVGLTLPNIFTVTNSPVTTTGSLTATLASQSANRLFASPNGSAGTPTFRSLVAADLGLITVPIANGGTGLASPILNNYVLASNGSAYQGREILVGTGLTLTPAAASFTFGLDLPNINITGLGGVLTRAQGGTGISTAPANGSLLIGNGTSWTNALLTAGSGISITNGVGTITIANTATGVSQLNGFTGSLNLSVNTANNDIQITNISPDIILSIPTASSTKRGALSSADWTTFNDKLSGSGTAGTIPIFTGTNSIGNSRLTYTSAFSTDTIDFASVLGLAVLKATGTVGGEVRAGATGVVTYINADATASNFGWTNAKPLNFIQGSTTRASFDASGNFAMNGGFNVLTSGNVQLSKGFATGSFAYKNDAGNYAFPSNELYGVVLGLGSDGAMNVTLPTSPMNGQQITILCMENKTITVVASGATIYGHNAGSSIAININTGSSAIIAIYSTASGANNWFLTTAQ